MNWSPLIMRHPSSNTMMNRIPWMVCAQVLRGRLAISSVCSSAVAVMAARQPWEMDRERRLTQGAVLGTRRGRT